MEIHAHKSQIFVDSKKYLYILIIPILQNLNFASNVKSFISLISSEVLLIIILLIYCFLKSRKLFINISDDGIKVHSGLILKRQYFIKLENIASINTRHQFIFIDSKTMLLSINTEALSVKSADITIAISAEDAEKIVEKFLPINKNEEKTYKFASKNIAFAAMVTSSSIVGISLIIPFVINLGKIINRKLSSELLDGAIISVKNVISLPKLVVFLLIFTVFGYIIAFLVVLTINRGFTLKRNKSIITVIKGSFRKQAFMFNIKSVNSFIIIASPIMQILKHFSAKITVAGFNINKHESSMLIPSATKLELNDICADIIPELKLNSSKKIHGKQCFASLLGYLLSFIPISIIITAALIYFEYTYKSSFGFFIAVVFLVILITAVHIKSVLNIYRSGYISFLGDIEFKTLSFFSIITGKIIEDRCALIRLTRYSYDKSGMCYVQLTVKSECSPQYYLKYIDYKSISIEIKERYNFK